MPKTRSIRLVVSIKRRLVIDRRTGGHTMTAESIDCALA